jgi:antigen flippase
MGADFYPRLTVMIHDRALAVRAVNEQTEIGILLALPGLLAALAFAPLLMKIVYSAQFLPAADLLPWMVIGVFGRVVSWPLGFIQLALGAHRSFAITETVFVGIQAGLTLWLLDWFGIVGAAYAYAVVEVLAIIVMIWVARGLIGFSWSSSVRELFITSSAFVGAAFMLRWAAADTLAIVGGGLVTLAASVYCLRGLAKRLGEGHKLAKALRLIGLVGSHG